MRNNANLRIKSNDWHSICKKLEVIPPENELNVLEILFKNGGLNQKSLASEIGVSEMIMSRIISRLETKQLVIR